MTTARALGVEDRARAAKAVLQSRVVRRNQRDDEHLFAMLAAILNPDSSCIDVGANVGDMLARMVRLAPDGVHHAFEPIPELAAKLDARYPSVTVHNVALAATDGEADFHFVPSDTGLSGLSQGKASDLDRQIIPVKLRRLDDLLPANYVPAVLKIDVEGAELGVLEGGLKLLERTHPIILMEHSRNLAPNFGTTPQKMFALLADLGYRVFDLDGVGPYAQAEFVDAFETHSRFNWLARL